MFHFKLAEESQLPGWALAVLRIAHLLKTVQVDAPMQCVTWGGKVLACFSACKAPPEFASTMCDTHLRAMSLSTGAFPGMIVLLVVLAIRHAALLLCLAWALDIHDDHPNEEYLIQVGDAPLPYGAEGSPSHVISQV